MVYRRIILTDWKLLILIRIFHYCLHILILRTSNFLMSYLLWCNCCCLTNIRVFDWPLSISILYIFETSQNFLMKRFSIIAYLSQQNNQLSAKKFILIKNKHSQQNQTNSQQKQLTLLLLRDRFDTLNGTSVKSLRRIILFIYCILYTLYWSFGKKRNWVNVIIF